MVWHWDSPCHFECNADYTCPWVANVKFCGVLDCGSEFLDLFLVHDFILSEGNCLSRERGKLIPPSQIQPAVCPCQLVGCAVLTFLVCSFPLPASPMLADLDAGKVAIHVVSVQVH
jgi:hypothetical protein